jgi:hypothetical protein
MITSADPVASTALVMPEERNANPSARFRRTIVDTLT